MRYKGAYRPAQLLDTADNQWYSLSELSTQLDKGMRYNFASARPNYEPISLTEGGADDDIPLPRPMPPGIDEPEAVFNNPEDCMLLWMPRPTHAILQRLDVRNRPSALFLRRSCSTYLHKHVAQSWSALQRLVGLGSISLCSLGARRNWHVPIYPYWVCTPKRCRLTR